MNCLVGHHTSGCSPDFTRATSTRRTLAAASSVVDPRPTTRAVAEDHLAAAEAQAVTDAETAAREAARRRAEEEAATRKSENAGDVEMGERRRDFVNRSGGGAGGVMRALAGGAHSLEEIKVEVEESGYEGDRDRTPKARDESA